MSEEKVIKIPTLKGPAKDFAEAYMDCFLSVDEAADAVDIKPGAAKKLLKQDAVRAYIKYHLHRLRLSPEEYVRHLEMIAFGDTSELYETVDCKWDDAGKVTETREQLRKVSEMPTHLRRMIKKLKSVRTKYGVDFSIDMVSREKAIELLGKIHLAQEINVEDVNKFGVLVLPGMSVDPDAWAKLAKASQKELSTPGRQQ